MKGNNKKRKKKLQQTFALMLPVRNSHPTRIRVRLKPFLFDQIPTKESDFVLENPNKTETIDQLEPLLD